MVDLVPKFKETSSDFLKARLFRVSTPDFHSLSASEGCKSSKDSAGAPCSVLLFHMNWYVDNAATSYLKRDVSLSSHIMWNSKLTLYVRVSLWEPNWCQHPTQYYACTIVDSVPVTDNVSRPIETRLSEPDPAIDAGRSILSLSKGSERNIPSDISWGLERCIWTCRYFRDVMKCIEHAYLVQHHR